MALCGIYKEPREPCVLVVDVLAAGKMTYWEFKLVYIISPVTIKTMGLRSITKGLSCLLGFHILQILLQSNIYRMCLTNKSMDASPFNLDDLKYLLLNSWCQIQQNIFWSLMNSMPQWIMAVLLEKGHQIIVSLTHSEVCWVNPRKTQYKSSSYCICELCLHTYTELLRC